ncbi:hypothetical protein KQ44_00240 [Brachyspira sp. G79]|nr:hypothetical protein KQ44_00240 [Brachyspira sp. G79]
MYLTPDSTIDFIKRMIGYFTFRVHCIQTDNSTEFTYRKHFFETEHTLDNFCKNKHIKRVYSPVASPWYNGFVESTHNRDQKEFYDYCTIELTLEKSNQKLKKYNNFWNYKRIHMIHLCYTLINQEILKYNMAVYNVNKNIFLILYKL